MRRCTAEHRQRLTARDGGSQHRRARCNGAGHPVAGRRQAALAALNMSAPTVLFVLERALAHGLPPRSLVTALGPGFTASCVSLRHAA